MLDTVICARTKLRSLGIKICRLMYTHAHSHIHKHITTKYDGIIPVCSSNMQHFSISKLVLMETAAVVTKLPSQKHDTSKINIDDGG